jgi:alkaline phosphatase D
MGGALPTSPRSTNHGRPDPSPFRHGVASFDPLPDRVLLWTLLDGGGTCDWEIATDAGLDRVVASGRVEVQAAPGTLTVDVTGLEPGTTYWYRFSSGPHRSPVGRTRTLPDAAVELFRVGVTCCARFGQSRFTAYRALAEREVDVVVHLGDYVYEDDKCEIEARRPEPDHACTTLPDYRARHAQARRDPDLQALHARHPMVVVWDDHDVADNVWSGGAKTHDDERDGPWAPRLDAALRAHQEFLPKRLADPTDLRSAWRHLDAGDLVRIVCTETRVAGRDQQAGIDGAAPADDPARSLLGDSQREWLLDTVADPGPRWVLLASGTVVSELSIPSPEALDGALPEKYAVVDQQAVNTDGWDGYLEERRRLAGALAARGGGNVVVSGDIHSAWAIEGPEGPDGDPAAVELVCPPAATTPLGQLLPPGAGARLAEAIPGAMAHVRWVDVDHHGFLVLELRRERADAAWWWVEPDQEAPARLGRRWSTPWDTTLGLADPDRRVARDRPIGDRSDAGGLRPRRRRRRRLVGALALASAVGAVRRSRRRP